MDSLVSTEWLAGELGARDLKVLDASWHLPSTGRDASAEFEAGHVPGARFLDLALLADRTSPLPNTLPTGAQFAERMAALGITPSDRVVLYDDSAAKTAARAWFVLRLHGFSSVAILDGGLGKWRAEGRELESGSATPHPAETTAVTADQSRVRSKAQMLANIGNGDEQVIDARDAGRFSGEIADTIHNLPGGHIPGARNLPFAELYRADGTFMPEAELRQAFIDAGVDLDRPIVTSCGSGVTASVLLFALDRLGVTDAALYDGSWSEWGADPTTPKETGAAR
jgi:thiosulfate/3-mercaptopyruvate sulfurtransferase